LFNFWEVTDWFVVKVLLEATLVNVDALVVAQTFTAAPLKVESFVPLSGITSSCFEIEIVWAIKIVTITILVVVDSDVFNEGCTGVEVGGHDWVFFVEAPVHILLFVES
jgi:hypothetical protein